jgi:hypothetical protein
VRTEIHTLRRLTSENQSGNSTNKIPSAVRVSLPFLLFFSPEVVLLVLAELPGRAILRCRSVSFMDYNSRHTGPDYYFKGIQTTQTVH